jgi:hypothetical protein
MEMGVLIRLGFHIFWPHVVPLSSIELAVFEGLQLALGLPEFYCEFHIFWPHLVPLSSIAGETPRV